MEFVPKSVYSTLHISFPGGHSNYINMASDKRYSMDDDVRRIANFYAVYVRYHEHLVCLNHLHKHYGRASPTVMAA